ncbi:MAG: hypothetical protein KGL62_15520, partial [Bradyrhizobium sp.]|uniref:Ig-like domain-containing protein n=1 Tax=Bradyrhizobium sp. TaxID=376 RepID=UPI002399D691
VRPAWQVAGVDYAVGVAAGVSLKDPTVQANLPTGVTIDSVNHVLDIQGNNVTLNGFDFSLHGGWGVVIEPGTTGTTTIENCNFSMGSSETVAISAGSSNVGNLTVLNCSFNGNQLNIPSVQPPPAGTGVGSAIDYEGTGTFIAKYNYIHDMPADGIDLGGGTPTIEYNVFAGLGYTPGAHPDPVQFAGGNVTNAMIAYNTIYQPQGSLNQNANEGLSLHAQLGASITNTTLANNVIIASGPNVSMSLDIGLFQDAGNVLNGVVVSNNYLDPTGSLTPTTGFGDLSNEVQGSNLTITGNVNMVTGQTTAPTAGTFSTTDPGSPPPPPPSPPAAPTIASFSPDSGVVGDHITNNGTLTLQGTAVAGSTVKVLDGTTLVGTATANSSGAWALTTSALANGGHSLTATATNSSGTSGASGAFAVTIDTIAPSAPTIAASTPSATLASTHIEALTGTAEANSTVTVFDGTNKLGTATANASGAWSYTTAALTTGTHNFTASATDAAGNTGAASAPVAVTISAPSTPPPPAAPTIASFSRDSGVVGDHITNDNTLTLQGTAVAGSTVKVLDGTKLVGTATANSSGAWTLTTSTLADGSHSLTAMATNASGTSGASGALAVTIDTHAPGAPRMALFSQTGSSVGRTTAHDDLVLKGQAESGSVVKVFDGSTLLGTTTTSGNGTWSLDTGHLGSGVHRFTSVAVDAAGNTSAASSAARVDVIGSSNVDSGLQLTNVVKNSAGLTVTGVADPNSTIKVFDGDTKLGSISTDSNGAWSFTKAGLSNSVHTITAQEVDGKGNVLYTSSGAAIVGSSAGENLYGTSGNDLLVGKGGSDTFVFAPNFSNDVIKDFHATGASHDFIQFNGGVLDNFANVLAHASAVGHNVVIAAGGNTLTLKDVNLAALDSHDFRFS